MTARPPRKTNPLLRIVMSAVLVAFAVFVVQYQKSTEHSQPSGKGPLKPFLSPAPSSEGSNRFAWVPHYPGAAVENISTKQTRDELTYGFNFRTVDDFKQALEFYRQQLESAGFKVEVKTSGEFGGELHANSDSSGRSLDVTAAKVLQGTGTEVGITAIQR
jgi:hypothetical protein